MRKSTLPLATMALAALLACMVALLTMDKTALAAFPSNNGKLAFSVTTAGEWSELYTINPDGSALRNLTRGPDYDPAWSPDGTKVAYYRHGDIFIRSVNGSVTKRMRLTHDGVRRWEFNPAWSPDGKKIVFDGSREFRGIKHLYVMRVSQPEEPPRRLTTGVADNYEPDWSPDGTKIAFVSDRDGDPEIYSMEAAPEGPGNVPTNLSSNAARDYDPDWSPDSTRIVFASERSGNAEIYRMKADGSARVRLTTTPLADESDPAYSPDQAKIAFDKGIQRPTTFSSHIYVMGSDGTDPRRVTADEEDLDYYDPDWQPLPPGKR